MSKVIGIADTGWFGSDPGGRRTDQRMYDQTTRAYGVEFELAESVHDIPLSSDLIIFDEEGELALEEFEHPDTATYVFGRSGLDLKLYFPDVPCIRISTPNDIPLFGHVACGIVLEDRRRKL